MSPLAEILASANRSLNDGLLAFLLVEAILVFIIIAAARSVAPLVA